MLSSSLLAMEGLSTVQIHVCLQDSLVPFHGAQRGRGRDDIAREGRVER